MYLVTNRAIDPSKSGLQQFLSTSGDAGALDLRILKVTGSIKQPVVTLLDDQLTQARVLELKNQFNLDIDEHQPHYQSLELACWLFAEATQKKKHISLFVHGYNNDVGDVISAVKRMQALYPDTLFVPFSWPAKGGGALSGTANYIDDKRDARASSGALDRVFQIIQKMHKLLTQGQSRALWDKAAKKHPDNPQAARELYVALQERVCKVSINLVCHSMGNYVLKHATLPTLTSIRTLIFDNVCLLAADTNNEDHDMWVTEIEAKGGVYVVINENDFALQWSRRKPGEEQKRRLGHYLKRLNAHNATYVDLTPATGVGDQHSYFVGSKAKSNKKLVRMFAKLFAGERPERLSSQMEYFADLNAYRLK